MQKRLFWKNARLKLSTHRIKRKHCLPWSWPVDPAAPGEAFSLQKGMYDHINQVDDFLWAERRMRITRLKPEKSFEELMFDPTNTNGPDEVRGCGWPNAVVRWCTFYLKTEVIRQFKKRLCCNPYHYIAFAADEKKRLKRKNNQNPIIVT